MKIQEEILDMKSKSDRKLEDKEDLTLVRHPMAKKINRIMFETEIPKKVKTIWGSFFFHKLDDIMFINHNSMHKIQNT